MRVKVLIDLADHLRTYVAEEVCEMPDDQAKRLLEAGLVVASDESSKAAKK